MDQATLQVGLGLGIRVWGFILRKPLVKKNKTKQGFLLAGFGPRLTLRLSAKAFRVPQEKGRGLGGEGR